ncbi:MAG: TraR/DksA C4-type zinc finger protein [Phycisphaerales bacterium]|nr:TraR/DksA C4-type zinc finger protein [Phycisphaerales bacterium]
MGKKAAKTTKTAAHKAASKKPTAKKSASKKPAAPAKPPAKVVKKGAAKDSAPKAAAKESASKAPASSGSKKAEPRKGEPGNGAARPASAPPKGKAPDGQATAKTAAAKKNAKQPAATAPASGSPGDAKGGAKAGRKGITIVTPKTPSKPKPVPVRAAVPALSGSILGMGLGSGRPLIPSGPKASPIGGPNAEQADGSGKKPKSPFTKKQLDKYREVLVQKRRELLGDIDSMESEALKSQSGSLSHLPQHMAEQGSETYEQSLSLDLAAADRVLLREIDAALVRIAERVYGLCERTGKEISKERLAELPWARYSIEAAREMERRTTLP